MKEIKWNLHKEKERPVENNDLRIVNLPVEAIIKWSDEIIADYDYETGTVLEYTSGYIIKVFPNQSFVYKDQESIFLGSVVEE